PAALSGQDVLATAQTGTGKTAAFMLPALERLSNFKKGPKGAPRVLVLTPTRELAAQITDATRTYGRFLRVRSTSILGGSSYRDQFRALSAPLDLAVATPGRLIDHLERGSIDLSRVEILVLDEADRMLDMGFKEDIEKVTKAVPAERQTMMFTATLNRTMETLAMKSLRKPVRISIAAKETTAANIEQRLHVADNLSHKQRMLNHLVGEDGLRQAIIFSATKRDADSLAKELKGQGHRAAALHGDMTQGARNRTLRDVRQGKVKLLVATDVAARGIDVSTISHVINFDLPKFAEDYVHRIGRTGRAGASGVAISFVSRSDAPALQRIQRLIGKTLPRYEIPGYEPTQKLDSRPGPARGKKGFQGKRTGQKPAQGNWKGGQGKPYAPKKRSASAPKPKREPVIHYR
ncbi:MAG: ATP-dependent helicase, partial [Desulfuromonas sp.]